MSKQRLTIGQLGTVCLAVSLFFCFSSQLHANTTRNFLEMYVTNPLSGSAIEGMDPVSYFTEPEPLMGKAEYEFSWKGVSWFFATEANKEVFRAAPEAYVPQFGGYGLAGVARGYLSSGNPRIYSVYNRRLYLFYSSGNREAFLLEKAAMVNFAFANWVGLRDQLARQ
ncbi:YHS domain-containing (seleno)protein [Maritalea sp.]|uniref:YHS domain-containing (seleno)protein n=1 Tax=Maritalea sp. TaxID=2003361 RepID=UPI003EF928D9